MTGKASKPVGTDGIKNYNVIERLRDQRTVTIRAIRPDDKGLIIDGLNQVSSESLYSRFLAIGKELTVEGLKKVKEVGFVNGLVLVAVSEKDGNDQIVGGEGASGRQGKAQRWHFLLETHSRASESHRFYSSI